MNKPGASLTTQRARLLAAGLACWLGFALVAWWQASGASAGFDRAGLLLWRQPPQLYPIGPAWLTDAMRGLTTLGGGAFRVPLGLAALALLLSRRYLREAMMLAAIMVPAAVINSGLKTLFDRPRPDLVPYLHAFTDQSFPSGHSLNGAATYLGLALIAAALLPRLRGSFFTMALCLSLGIAFSRVWLGVHYPTDAIAGWLGGTGWVLVVTALIQPRGNRS